MYVASHRLSSQAGCKVCRDPYKRWQQRRLFDIQKYSKIFKTQTLSESIAKSLCHAVPLYIPAQAVITLKFDLNKLSSVT